MTVRQSGLELERCVKAIGGENITVGVLAQRLHRIAPGTRVAAYNTPRSVLVLKLEIIL